MKNNELYNDQFLEGFYPVWFNILLHFVKTFACLMTYFAAPRPQISSKFTQVSLLIAALFSHIENFSSLSTTALSLQIKAHQF